MFLEIIQYIALFSLIDRVLTHYRLDGVYYIVHAIHNAMIVAATWPDVTATFTDIYHLADYPTNSGAIQLCVALHLYHVLLYWRSLRHDDWLHHGLMIGVALPLASMVDAHSVLGLTLFFTTGLPGGIDYSLLALVKNGCMSRVRSRSCSGILHVWIRSPGCIAAAAIGIATYTSSPASITDSWAKTVATIIPCLITFWNGQYFMRQVVENYAIIKFEGKE